MPFFICQTKYTTNPMKILILSILMFTITTVRSQNNTLSSGGQANGANGSVSYSIGQAFFSSASGGNGTIIQGNQQPYEISVITGIRNTNIDLKAQVYPNPVVDNLILVIRNTELKNLSYVLVDMQGKVLRQNKITNTSTTIETTSYSNGVYFIKVLDKQKPIKTFKIVKNK